MIAKHRRFYKILLYIGLIFWSFIFCLVGWYEDNYFTYATSDPISSSNIWNIDVMNLPQLDNYVVDFSNTLNPIQLGDLNKKASDYDISTSNEFTVVLIPNRQGNELYDISLSIFRSNGIGKSSDNNWLLLVASPSEKKLRIMVWYGLEGDLPDILVKQVIEADLRPYLDSWDIVGMINSYYDIFGKILSDDDYKASYMINNAISPIKNQDIIITVFMICFFIGLFSSISIPKLSSIKNEEKISKIQNIISNISLILIWVVFLSMLIKIFAISVWAIWYIFGAILWFIITWKSASTDGWWWFYWWWFGWFWWGSFGGWWFGWFWWWSSWWGGAGD